MLLLSWFVLCTLKKKKKKLIFFLNQAEQRFIILLRMLTFIYIVHTYTVYMYKMFFCHTVETVVSRFGPGGSNCPDPPQERRSDSMCRFLSEALGCKCHIVVFGGVRAHVHAHTYTHTEALQTEGRKEKNPASAENSARPTAAWQKISPTPPPPPRTK